MGTPLQQRAYELSLRVSQAWIVGKGARHSEDMLARLFEAGTSAGVFIEQATAASSKELFRARLHDANTRIRVVKFWIRLLDDLALIEPETASSLHESAEELHALLFAALRTTS